MADTAFVSKITKIIVAWLQPVNDWVYKGRNPNFATTGGAADAQTLTLPPTSLYASPADGDTFSFIAGFTNTGAATLAVGGTAAAALEWDGTALSAGEIKAGSVYTVRRSGATWQVQGGLSVTAFARTLLDDANAAAARTTMDVPANAEAVLKATLAANDGKLIVGDAASSVRYFAPPGFCSGLVPSNAVDTANDITVTSGLAVDDTDTKLAWLSANMTKRIDAAWAAGNNSGGLFSGAVADSTWYYCWLIQKDSDNSVDWGFDVSAVGANVPAGYTRIKRIGAVYRNAASSLEPFVATELSGGGLYVRWTTPELTVDVTNTLTTSRYTAIIRTPNLACKVGLRWYVTDAAGGLLVIQHPEETDAAPSASVSPLATTAFAAGVARADSGEFYTNGSSIAVRATVQVDTFRMLATHWILERR